jgi:hypothetical protein
MNRALETLIAAERGCRSLAKEWIRRAGYARMRARLKRATGYAFTTDYVTANEAAWAAHLQAFAGREGVRLLEIGSYEGRSAVWFLEHVLTHPTSRLVSVDPNALPAFEHNLRVSGAAARVERIQRRSEDVLASLPPESFDIVYVDGSHRALNVLFDAVASAALLKPGGVLILDDYRWEPGRPPAERPQMAIDLFLASFASRFDVLLDDYQVILRKTGTI